jgi:oligosaccharide reducing-end xylanase
LQVGDGPAAGYFKSFCDLESSTVECLDPFGLQQMVMALILAHDRYTRAGANPGPVDYQAEARRLLALMRHKQDQNGGVVGGVTDTFDASTRLVFDIPDVSAAGVGRPSIEMPAYYDLWAQATGDPFWTGAAVAARSYWQRSAHPTTGLFPVRATFATGAPVMGSANFEPESYRTLLNLVLDVIWSGSQGWAKDESDRLLGFFLRLGLATYGGSFTLDGSVTITTTHDAALVAMNGVTALTATATLPERASFINAVWNQTLVTGFTRYYSGLLDLLALLALSGQFRVY